MYAHLLSSAGVRDADLSFAGEAEENASGRDALEISGPLVERRSSAIGGTPSPRREPTVATVDALRETVPALNRALEDLGYPLALELLLPDAADLARTCDVLFLLLRDRQEDLAARDAWADERARARADVAAADTRAERLRVSRDAEAAARAADANRRDRADEESRARLERMTSERDAARRDLRASTRKLARLEHETRRRELENDRLKARLSAVVESAGDDAGLPGHRKRVRFRSRARVAARFSRRRRKKKKAARRRERPGVSGPGPSPAVSLALHHSMMAAYEAKLRAFMHDANDLRAMLRDREGVDAETRGASSSAAKPERRLAPHREAPARTAPRVCSFERDADADADAELDEDPERALDAFAFSLASLRDRLGDADAEERDANRLPGCEDARAAAAAALAAAAPASPVEIALRWHEREHARLSQMDGLGASSASGSAPGSPGRSRIPRPDASERLAWNRVETDDEPVRSRAFVSAPSPPPPAIFSGRPRPDVASPASPEVSSSEPDDDDAGGRLGALGVRGAFAAARGDGSSSEEVFEEVFDPPARANKPEPERLLPRREKAAARLRRGAPAGDAPAGDAPAGDAPAGDAPASDAPAGDAPAGASAPASPASPLDALLASHLGKSRGPAAGWPRDRSEWLEKRRRRAQPLRDRRGVTLSFRRFARASAIRAGARTRERAAFF